MPYSTSSLSARPHEASDGLSNAASGHLPHSSTNTSPTASTHGTHIAPTHGTYASSSYGANNVGPSAAAASFYKHRSSHATSAWPGITQTTTP